MAAALALVALLTGVTDTAVIRNRRLERNETVASALARAGLDTPTITAVHEALAAADFDFRRARVGDQLRLVFRGGRLDALDYRRSVLTEWQVRRDGGGFVGRRLEVEREQRVDVVELNVETSIWDAAVTAGERPDLAVTLSDVFAWDVDFYRDVQKGDRMRAVIEKTLHRGRLISYGAVLAAEYVGASVGTRRSFRYQLPDGTESYFMEDGASARKTFLKSPLKYANVTSRFGGRLHPVRNEWASHNGVDYHAPVGTPVWAVADGTVTRAGFESGGGNTVCVRHAMRFESCYLHLSKLLVKVGQKVAQKTVIAESGNTGALTTGPHLHFGMKRGGAWVNPLNQNFPRAEPLPRELVPDFQARIAAARDRLNASPLAAFGAR